MITPEEQKLDDLEYVKRCTIPYVLLKDCDFVSH